MSKSSSLVTKGQRHEQLLRMGRIPGGKASQAALEKMELVNIGQVPKFAPAFKLITEAIPDFTWKVKVAKNGSTFVHHEGYPRVDGEAPSIADLVRYARGELHLEFDVLPHGLSTKLKPITDLGPVGVAFARMLIGIGISTPPIAVVEAVAVWLKRAIAGEKTTVFSGVCPDYANEGGRYTFNSLGTGVGLVAQRMQRAIPYLHQFCQKYNLKVQFVVAIGDFEADSDETLLRVGLTRDEFHGHLRRSQQALADSLSEIPIVTPFATEVGDFYGALTRCHGEVAAGFRSGPLELSGSDFEAICTARLSLYQRWYGDGVNPVEILDRQSPEYGAMATVAEVGYNNVLIIGADAPVMAPFWQQGATAVRPVVYLRGADY